MLDFEAVSFVLSKQSKPHNAAVRSTDARVEFPPLASSQLYYLQYHRPMISEVISYNVSPAAEHNAAREGGASMPPAVASTTQPTSSLRSEVSHFFPH